MGNVAGSLNTFGNKRRTSLETTKSRTQRYVFLVVPEVLDTNKQRQIVAQYRILEDHLLRNTSFSPFSVYFIQLCFLPFTKYFPAWQLPNCANTKYRSFLYKVKVSFANKYIPLLPCTVVFPPCKSFSCVANAYRCKFENFALNIKSSRKINEKFFIIKQKSNYTNTKNKSRL